MTESSKALQFLAQAYEAVAKPTSIFQMGSAMPVLLLRGVKEPLMFCFSQQLFLSPAPHDVVVAV